MAGNRSSYTNCFPFRCRLDLSRIDAIHLVFVLISNKKVRDYLETGQHSVWLGTIRVPSEYRLLTHAASETYKMVLPITDTLNHVTRTYR